MSERTTLAHATQEMARRLSKSAALKEYNKLMIKTKELEVELASTRDEKAKDVGAPAWVCTLWKHLRSNGSAAATAPKAAVDGGGRVWYAAVGQGWRTLQACSVLCPHRI